MRARLATLLILFALLWAPVQAGAVGAALHEAPHGTAAMGHHVPTLLADGLGDPEPVCPTADCCFAELLVLEMAGSGDEPTASSPAERKRHVSLTAAPAERPPRRG